MKFSLYLRFSLLMFLEYAVLGAWMAVLPVYLQASTAAGGLGFEAYQVGRVIGLAGAIGAITAPLVAGQAADRHFRTEWYMAFLLTASGLLKWYASYQTSYVEWLCLSVAFSIVYVPTLSLANSIVFHHVEDGERHFPSIRVWGTIGFIAAMWTFPWIYLERNLEFQWLPPFLAGEQVENATAQLGRCLEFSGMISLVFAGFCLLLPKTLPTRDAAQKFAFLKALALFKKPSFAILWLITLPIIILHTIYWIHGGPFLKFLGIEDSDIAPAMSIGPIAEILFMAALGLVLKRFGARWVISVGCLSYGLRFIFFGMHETLPVPFLLATQALHGVGVAAFVAGAFIYADRVADADVRHSVQALLALSIFGVAPTLAGELYPVFTDWSKDAAGELNHAHFWYIMAAIGLVSTVVFALLFRHETRSEPPTGAC
jgi:nucleoside transporter